MLQAGYLFSKNRGNLGYVLRVTPGFLLTRKTHLYVIKSMQTFIKRSVDTEFGSRKFGQFLREKSRTSNRHFVLFISRSTGLTILLSDVYFAEQKLETYP